MLNKYNYYVKIILVGDCMKKAPIGIIDMNINNISVLNELSRNFKYENFVYINDLAQVEYEGLTAEAINERVKKNIEYLLGLNVKLIVVVSNTIIEYCEEYLKTLKTPIISIVNTIINYVNKNYEHKNILFMTTHNVMEANIYQRNFRYNHLYSAETDELEKIVINKKMKTNKSFAAVEELLLPYTNKNINVIIPTTFNMLFLTTEIKEFMPFIDIVDLNGIIIEKISSALLTLSSEVSRRKGKVLLLINVPKKHLKINHLLNIKYKIKIIINKEK